ncbi:aldehyde dehydrogenase family protein, partial [Staphylococcus aureus]
EAFSNMKVREPIDEAKQMGIQTGKDKLDKSQDYIEAEKEIDAQIVAGGHRLTENGLHKGYFSEPKLIAVPDHHHKLAQEEILGPVLTVIKVK